MGGHNGTFLAGPEGNLGILPKAVPRAAETGSGISEGIRHFKMPDCSISEQYNTHKFKDQSVKSEIVSSIKFNILALLNSSAGSFTGLTSSRYFFQS